MTFMNSTHTPWVTFFSPVKNDWDLMRGCLKSCQRKLLGIPHEILLIDDHSTQEESKKIPDLLRQFPRVRLVSNEGVHGIMEAVGRLTQHAQAPLLAPLSADMRLLSFRWIVQVLFIFYFFSHIKLVFGKTQLVDVGTRRKLGVVGWSPQKGNIPSALGVQGVCDGSIRVAGGSVVYRKEWFIKSGGFKPEAKLGPKSDFFLNHLAVLQGSSFYCSTIAACLLEGRPSYGNRFKTEDYRLFCQRVLREWEKEGVFLDQKLQEKYLRTEIEEARAVLEGLG